ncbi:MAG: hypothetical protein R3C39_02750 [Dehalococcoidia bacterium]
MARWVGAGLMLVAAAAFVALVGATEARAQEGATVVGESPGPGGIGLMVTARETNAVEVRGALAVQGCDVQTLAVIEQNQWRVHIEGAPDAVNAVFPTTLAANTAFFVRCQLATANSLTVQLVNNASVTTQFANGGTAQLQDGRFSEPAAPGSASMNTVQISRTVFGDLNGDADLDAAVILVSSGGGTGSFYEVAALLAENGLPVHAGSILLGDRIDVTSISIQYGVITVVYLDRPEGAPFAEAPSVPVTRQFRVDGGTLVEVGS